jgi:hypothetical protein
MRRGLGDEVNGEVEQRREPYLKVLAGQIRLVETGCS